jgi:hypothetical protein
MFLKSLTMMLAAWQIYLFSVSTYLSFFTLPQSMKKYVEWVLTYNVTHTLPGHSMHKGENCTLFNYALLFLLLVKSRVLALDESLKRVSGDQWQIHLDIVVSWCMKKRIILGHRNIRIKCDEYPELGKIVLFTLANLLV